MHSHKLYTRQNMYYSIHIYKILLLFLIENVIPIYIFEYIEI